MELKCLLMTHKSTHHVTQLNERFKSQVTTVTTDLTGAQPHIGQHNSAWA